MLLLKCLWRCHNKDGCQETWKGSTNQLDTAGSIHFLSDTLLLVDTWVCVHWRLSPLISISRKAVCLNEAQLNFWHKNRHKRFREKTQRNIRGLEKMKIVLTSRDAADQCRLPTVIIRKRAVTSKSPENTEKHTSSNQSALSWRRRDLNHPDQPHNCFIILNLMAFLIYNLENKWYLLQFGPLVFGGAAVFVLSGV